MKRLKQLFFTVTTLAMACGQRPFFAGFRPIGYPELSTPAADELGNRVGDENSTVTAGVPTTTQRLPVEANGDRELVDRLSKLPIDKQPFWFINWQALEAHRKNPQTYPQRPSQFGQSVQPIVPIQPAPSNDDAPFRVGDDSKPNIASTEANKPSKSANRDVDLSAFLNNGATVNVAGKTNLPSNTNSRLTASPNDDTLSNRNLDDTSNESAVKNPQHNIVLQSPKPQQNQNAGQVVTSFENAPYNSNIHKKSISNSKPNPSWNPHSFESPYPILDPLTRHPEQWPMTDPNSNSKAQNNVPVSVNTSPPLENKFSGSVEQQKPLISENIKYIRLKEEFPYWLVRELSLKSVN